MYQAPATKKPTLQIESVSLLARRHSSDQIRTTRQGYPANIFGIIVIGKVVVFSWMKDLI